PVNVIEECYAHIAKYESDMHSFITLVDKDAAIAKAQKIAKGFASHPSALAGIPYVMKDAYITRGIRTTAASKILDTFIPPYSATVHRKLEEAGAILIGKMNMDAWGHGASTENTDYGACKNPWDLTRSAGGSGGGPAAAIAARFCSFGIGEDTGGSIRNPAAWNNISAMKVTYGRVSRYGAIAYASSLDTVGPTAKTAEDCAVVLETIAGVDPYDATSSPRPVPSYTKELSESIKGKKIAFPVEFYGEALDPEIKAAIGRARDMFASLGAEVEEVSLPMLEFGVPVYYILAPSETSSNLGRYDGVRYGAGRELFTKETKRRIMTGTYALSSGYYDAYYKKAQKVRSLFIEEYKKLLSEYDAILSPVTPIMPSKFGELLDDPMKNMMADLYTVTVNIVGLPSLSIPCGFGTSGLPIGMQLVGNMFSESTLLSLGAAYQKVTDWHIKRPLPVI
ncbi:MAG: Asp-tRNA(Asn)/Glu-tRNA(Gln) amidotransferase subunit GatA, partial [Patescibacteria group bacterium]